MNTKELDSLYIAGTYNRFPLEIAGGKGSVVWDETGKEYIDLGSGIAVTSFGISDDEWVAAVTAQLNKVQHTSNLYYTEPCVKLAEMMCTRTGMKKVFFSNSGAEANECAIKVARKYAAEHNGPDCSVIVTLRNSFHGRTLTTLAATGQDHYHELFQPLTPDFMHVNAGDVEEVKALLETGRVAAVLMECVQGEGGVLPIDPEYARTVQQLVHEHNALLMIDEVQTGNGRSGKLYAYMNYGLEPDVVSTAKGLCGGLPLGATLLGEKVQNVFGFGDHGSTFGANPVCCAGALSVFSRLTDDFLQEVTEKSTKLREKLSGAEGIEDVRGLGLMLGLKTTKPAAQVVKECMERGVLCLTAKDHVRLLPALNIPMPVLEKAADIIIDVCKA